MDRPQNELLDLITLDIFRAVVRENGVTRAAARLNRVQSNVTTRIKQLEEDLGVRLFTREGRRMALTPAGRELLPFAERLLSLAGEARRSVCDVLPRGRFRLGAMESTAASRLPTMLANYRRTWRDVSIELVVDTSEALIQQLRDFKLDAMFVAGPIDVSDLILFECESVYFEELLLVTPHGHPPVLGPVDLKLDTMVAFDRGCSYRRVGEKWFANAGIQPERIVEVEAYHAMLAWIAAGSGFGFVPRSTLETVRHLEEVSVHSLGTLGRVETLLVWREGHFSSALNALRTQIAEQAAARLNARAAA
ncbi:LysR family transcriptional regulator [Pararobbsia alpina]|uniref:LysR family transcriptional regulator n=1 Tax=Pararobbsia alpina TaxID=621374 RepID=UPI001FE7D151|nr:LysR family transcriptional regulator [Pararobbsia alpina]